MNLVETYVTNITSAERKHNEEHDFYYWEIVADTDCYGSKEIQKTLRVCDKEYEQIQKYGCYLT